MAQDTLRVMVVDEIDLRAEAVAEALRQHGYAVVGHALADDYLPSKVQEAQPDVILVDVNAPSRDTLEQITAITRDDPRPVVMFSRQQDRDVIGRAVRAGVTAYVVDGLASAPIRSIIDVAMETFQQFQALRDELQKTKASLRERKTVDRAKGILMAQRHLSEPEAYGMMRKLAMDRKRKLVEVAESIIDMAELFEPKPTASSNDGRDDADQPGSQEGPR